MGGNALIASVFPGGRRSERRAVLLGYGDGLADRQRCPRPAVRPEGQALSGADHLGTQAKLKALPGAGREGGVLDSRRTRPAE